MKAKDLIIELQKLNPETEIVIHENDGWYTDDITLEENEKYVRTESGSKTIQCVVIF